jgi:hypothetical protein
MIAARTAPFNGTVYDNAGWIIALRTGKTGIHALGRSLIK